MRWRAVNACIMFVPMLDGKALLTVESLSSDGALHPVQRETRRRNLRGGFREGYRPLESPD